MPVKSSVAGLRADQRTATERQDNKDKGSGFSKTNSEGEEEWLGNYLTVK